MGEYYESLERTDHWYSRFLEMEQGRWDNLPDKDEDLEEEKYLYER